MTGLWRRTLPKRLLGLIPYVHACDGSEVKRTFYGLTPIQAWDRAGRWLAGQERGSSDA